jgi:hypothetical protein
MLLLPFRRVTKAGNTLAGFGKLIGTKLGLLPIHGLVKLESCRGEILVS